MRTILFVNFTPYKNTPVYAPLDSYIKRVDITESVTNPGDPVEVENIAVELWREAMDHIRTAAEGGDQIIFALPGTTLMAAALVIRAYEVHSTVGIITATRDGEEYAFDLNTSRVLWI